jgi:hypothetical protein
MPPSLPPTRISEQRAFLKLSGKGIIGRLTRCVKAVDICPGDDVNSRALLKFITPVDQCSPRNLHLLP